MCPKFSRDSVTITHALDDDIHLGPLPAKASDCCFTYIRFEKVYPGDVTARVTLGDGRSIKREFTNNKTVRTAFVGPDGDLEGEDNTGLALLGGLGRCVDVDIDIVDASNAVKIARHYHFRLCCDDPHVKKGETKLTGRDFPANPGEPVVKTPLLGIKDLRRNPCP